MSKETLLVTRNPALLHLKSFVASPRGYLSSRLNYAKILGLPRWSNPQSLHDDWDERTALIAGMIQPNTSILEFGSGNERLQDFLPQGCKYQPSDIVARSDKTWIIDLNKEFPVLDKKWDYIVFSGVLEYIYDVQQVLNHVRKHCDVCILSYAPTDCLECMITRMRSGWVNHLSKNSFETIIKNAGFEIQEKRVWNGQDIYSLR